MRKATTHPNRVVALLFAAALGCGSGEEKEPVAATLPDAAVGAYTAALSGEWTGTCMLDLQTSDAVLSSLVATRGSWRANLPGPYHAKSITSDGGSFHMKWDETVLTNGTPVRQKIEMVVPEAAFSLSGFLGTYTHESDLTGSHGGEISATRK